MKKKVELSSGALDEAQIRHNWEIVQIVSASDKKLITYSHRDNTKLPSGCENTVPTLYKKDNNGRWQNIHSHFSWDWNNLRWLVDHLDYKLDDSHISEFICDYGCAKLKADKNKNKNGREEDDKKKDKEKLKYDNAPYVKSKYNKSFFAETIPNLATMHFLAKDGTLMVPFCPWTIYNIYLNKNRYQGVYSIEFLKPLSAIDDAHKNWNEIMDNSNIMTKERKKNSAYQKEHIYMQNWGAIIHKQISTLPMELRFD